MYVYPLSSIHNRAILLFCPGHTTRHFNTKVFHKTFPSNTYFLTPKAVSTKQTLVESEGVERKPRRPVN
jgi:hypothetical protein